MGVISSNVYSRLLLIPPDNLRHLWGNLGNSYQTRLKWKSQFFLLFKNIFGHIWLYLGCFAKHEQTHLKWECEILPSLDVFLHAKKAFTWKNEFCQTWRLLRKLLYQESYLVDFKQNETEWNRMKTKHRSHFGAVLGSFTKKLGRQKHFQKICLHHFLAIMPQTPYSFPTPKSMQKVRLTKYLKFSGFI